MIAKISRISYAIVKYQDKIEPKFAFLSLHLSFTFEQGTAFLKMIKDHENSGYVV